MSQVLRISAENIASRSMDHLNLYIQWKPAHMRYMNEVPGKEHYRFLAEVSHLLADGSYISDVGTYYGTSALALSSNPNVSVVTYDIVQCIPTEPHVLTPLSRPNILQKLIPGQLDISTIAKSHVVLLDIDPHNGSDEKEFFQMLITNGFRGVLVCDDINLNPGMKSFWSTIPPMYKKMEITSVAHWSGTGLVLFDPTFITVEMF
jgi:hypothetical protein